MIVVEVRVFHLMLLVDCLCCEVLSTFWIKGQVLQCKEFHLTVHGWLSDFSAVQYRRANTPGPQRIPT